MQVLVVTSMYPTAERPNYGIFVADQVCALRAAGVSVDVLRLQTQQSRMNYALMLPMMIHKLQSAPYDVLHTHHTYSLLVVELARRLARSKTPLVLTSHEGEVLDTGHKTRTWHPTSRLRHSIWLKRYAARRADFTIFVSKQIATTIAPDIGYEIIPCGVNLDVFKPLDRVQCRTQLNIPLDAVVLFFPNSPSGKGKRFALVRAAHEILRQRLPAATLLTAGKIPHELMPVYYNAADVIIQASFYEASPTVVKEALACEIPIVSTDAGDTRELVDGVPYCLMCSDDASDLAAQAQRCVGRRAIGGRQRLRDMRLGLDQVAERVIQVYQRVDSRKRERYAYTWHS